MKEILKRHTKETHTRSKTNTETYAGIGRARTHTQTHNKYQTTAHTYANQRSMCVCVPCVGLFACVCCGLRIIQNQYLCVHTWSTCIHVPFFIRGNDHLRTHRDYTGEPQCLSHTVFEWSKTPHKILHMLERWLESASSYDTWLLFHSIAFRMCDTLYHWMVPYFWGDRSRYLSLFSTLIQSHTWTHTLTSTSVNIIARIHTYTLFAQHTNYRCYTNITIAFVAWKCCVHNIQCNAAEQTRSRNFDFTVEINTATATLRIQLVKRHT